MADFTSVAMLTESSEYRELDFQLDTGFPQSENAFQFLLARDGSNDLFVIKKVDTGTNSTEVHIFSTHPSDRAVLETGTALHETDHSWTFALACNRDLFAIRKSVTSSDRSQLRVLSHESGYKSFRHQSNILPNDHKLGHDYEFLLDSNDDLWVIKKQRTPSMTEIRVLSAASGYKAITEPMATGLPWTDFTWSFLGVDPNNKDVWVVNKKERELYRLTKKSLYKDTERVKLDSPKLAVPRFDRRCSIALAPNRTVVPATFDLYVFKTSRTSGPFVTLQVVTHPFHKHGPRVAKVRDPISVGCVTTDDGNAFSWITRSTIPVNNNGTDSSVEKGDGVEESYLRIVRKIPTWTSTDNYFRHVSLFSESSRFQGPGITMITPWPVTGETCEFLFAKNMDMFVIKKFNCDSKSVEVRVLSWESKYKSFTLDVPTILDEVDHTWTFLLADNLDLICINKSGTESKKTECLRMLYDDGAGGHYTSWSQKTDEGDVKTALPETDDSWEFLLAPNDDLYAIQKYETSSKHTEIKVLSAESDWKEITHEFQTELPETDYNYSFCLTADRDLVAVQKSRFPCSKDMASI